MHILFKFLIIGTLLTGSLNAETKHFKRLDEAVNTFIAALAKKDETVLSQLFTPKYKTFFASKAEENEDIKQFFQKYSQAHKLISYDAKALYIEVGEPGWTFPVPLLEDGNGWYFDMHIGHDNIVTRQIGRNELAVIEALLQKKSAKVLNKSPLSRSYLFSRNSHPNILLIATPREYGVSGIMSFVLTKDGTIYEANLGGKGFTFDKRFKRVDDIYMPKGK